MDRDPNGIGAAREVTVEAERALYHSPAFEALSAAHRAELLGDLDRIRQVLAATEPIAREDPYAFQLETPADLRRRIAESRRGAPRGGGGFEPTHQASEDDTGQQSARPQATETLAGRAGALIDEVDFVSFVAGLIHGTFDAIVDASIRQMEAFAELVSAVAKNVDQFTQDNVTHNQVRDWLSDRYPQDLMLDLGTEAGSSPRLLPRGQRPDGFGGPTPTWLGEYGLGGQELTEELIEEQLIPMARREMGEARLQMLATMVLLGMNRVVVRDGSIVARVRFRAAARDRASVDFATGADPQGDTWSSRGRDVYQSHTTMVSSVGVNAQTETTLQAELFGEVRLNFASETLPLEAFADPARLALLTRNSRYTPPVAGQGQQPPAATASPPVTAPIVPVSPPSVVPPAVSPPAMGTPPSTTPPPSATTPPPASATPPAGGQTS